MDDLAYEHVLVSALRKLALIDKNDIMNITIGPNSPQASSENRNLSVSSSRSHNNKSSKYESDEQSKKSSKNRDCASMADLHRLRQENNMPLRYVMKNIDFERRKQVENAVQAYAQKINDHTRSLEEQRKIKLQQQRQAIINNLQQEEEQIQNMVQEFERKKSAEKIRMTQHLQKLAEQRKQNAAQLEDRKKKSQEFSANLKQLESIIKEYSLIYTKTVALITPYLGYEDFRRLIDEDYARFASLLEEINGIIKKCKTCQINGSEIEVANDALTKVKFVYDEFEIAVSEFKKKLNAAAKSGAKSEIDGIKSVPAAVSENVDTAKQPEDITPPEQKNTSAMNKPVGTVATNRDVDKNNFKTYLELLEFLRTHIDSVKELEEHPRMKDFKFDCKKAINIPVNSISAVSSQHLNDKFEKLANVLSGKTVEIGNKNINVSRHPQGVAYCTNLLAKKMVTQGDLMVSSNPKSAFCFATVILSLWNNYPLFGKLLLAYFFKNCPYLVPYYIQPSPNYTDEEYYTLLGYRYEDGKIEKQDKFLKRMTGIMRLYAAILISRPKRSQKNHPYGIDHAWRWLVSFLKLKPYIDISATMLHTFLEVAGYHMQQQYGKMFMKLMWHLMEKYIPVLKENDTGGPVTRLVVLLDDFKKTGSFEKPDGLLPVNFW